MGLLNAILSLRDRYGAKDFITSRLVPFLGLGFSAFIPIIHAALIFPYDQLKKQSGLPYYYLEGLLMLIGVVFLAVRSPPCWIVLHIRTDDRLNFPKDGFLGCSITGVRHTKSFTVLLF